MIVEKIWTNELQILFMWCSPESDRTLSCLGIPVILYIPTSIENIMQQPPQCAWGSVAIGDWRNNCQRQDWQFPWCLERHQHATHLPNGSPNGSTDPTDPKDQQICRLPKSIRVRIVESFQKCRWARTVFTCQNKLQPSDLVWLQLFIYC